MAQQTQAKQIPSGWKKEEFKEIIEILDSKRKPINSTERATRIGKIPYYGATGQVGWIDDYLFDEELVLLGEDGAPFLDAYKDKAYIIKGKSWVNNHAHVLKAKNGLNNKFLLHLLNNLNYHDYVTGTTRLKLNQARMISIPIILPSLPEQTLIVQEIEKQFTRLDASVKSLKSVKQKLEVYRKAVLKKAFEKKESWEEKKISEVCEIKGGKRVPKGEKFSESITKHPYLRVVDFENYSINQKNLCYLDDSLYNKISRYVIYDNEVYISIAGTIGRVGIIPSNLNGANLTENAAKLTNLKDVEPKLLMYYLSSPHARELISFSTKSTSQPKLALFRIGNLSFNFPKSKEEQTLIVQEIESKFSVIDKIEQVVEASLEKAEKLRKSILKSAFEGKLVKIEGVGE